MEEQEKKTRKATSVKKNTTQGSAKTKATNKVTTTTAKKKSNTEKEVVTTKTAKKTMPKEKPKAEKEKKVVNTEKKPRKVVENNNLEMLKEKTVKASKIKEDNAKPSIKKEPSKKTKEVEKIKKSTNEKTTSTTQNKVEQPKEQKHTENTNRYIEISIGGIIAIVFIGLLIILNITLGKRAYNMYKEDNTTQNNVIDTDAEVEEKIGTVLNHKNEIVDKLIKKITFPMNTTASIYMSGAFDENTISDDMKLRIGWANLEETSKYHAKQANGETTIVVERSEIEKSIKEILGEQVKYKDASFDNTNVKEFSEYAETQGIIKYDAETYTGIANEPVEEAKVAFVYQEVQKVVKYENEIVFFMKSAFIKQENDKYKVYQSYNEEFKNELMEITSTELFENITIDRSIGKATIATVNTQALNDIREELNTYKYIFEKDELTGEYYLKEFQNAEI